MMATVNLVTVEMTTDNFKSLIWKFLVEITLFSGLFLRHGWNLTVLPNNSGSILRHLGAVPGKET